MKVFRSLSTCFLGMLGMLLTAQESAKIPNFDARIAVGIIRFDEEIACGKMKIKNKEEIAVVSKQIVKFNRAMDELKFRHFIKLNDTELMANIKQKSFIATKDFQGMTELRIEIHEALRPVRIEVTELNEGLNESLKSVLSDRQFKKWKKYVISVRKELYPSVERKESPAMNTNSMGGMNRGRNRGMNRGGMNRRMY